MQKVQYKNTQISFDIKGNKTNNMVVFIHGFLESSRMWDAIKPKLNEECTIITIDLLGHGSSGNIDAVYTMEEQAKVVKIVLDELKINKVTLIGHSMGGYVALAFTELYPEYVSKICLINATTQKDSEERYKNRSRAIKLAEKHYEALIKMSVSNLFIQKVQKQKNKKIEELKKQALTISKEAYISATKGMQLRENKEITLRNFQGDKLMIIGKNDPLIICEDLLLEAKITNTPTIILDSGHMPHIEAEEKLINCINNFIYLK